MITRIKPPKYKVGKYSLNEYELRQLMLEVAKKEKPAGQTVKDQTGRCATIQEDGSLSCNLFGTDIMSLTTIQMIKLRREREGKCPKDGRENIKNYTRSGSISP